MVIGESDIVTEPSDGRRLGCTVVTHPGDYRGSVLPSWLDVTMLKWLSIALLILLTLIAVWVMRLVRRTALRATVFLVLVAMGLTVWLYRDSLDECRVTCSCQLLGLDVDFTDQAEFICDNPTPIANE